MQEICELLIEAETVDTGGSSLANYAGDNFISEKSLLSSGNIYFLRRTEHWQVEDSGDWDIDWRRPEGKQTYLAGVSVEKIYK